jgi:hypothetical protein
MENARNGALEIGRHCSVSLYDAKKHGFVITSTNPEAQYILFAVRLCPRFYAHSSPLSLSGVCLRDE